MQIVTDFMPSSFSRIACVVKNDKQVEIGRSSASVDDSADVAKRITCDAFSVAPIVPRGLCE